MFGQRDVESEFVISLPEQTEKAIAGDADAPGQKRSRGSEEYSDYSKLEDAGRKIVKVQRRAGMTARDAVKPVRELLRAASQEQNMYVLHSLIIFRYYCLNNPGEFLGNYLGDAVFMETFFGTHGLTAAGPFTAATNFASQKNGLEVMRGIFQHVNLNFMYQSDDPPYHPKNQPDGGFGHLLFQSGGSEGVAAGLEGVVSLGSYQQATVSMRVSAAVSASAEATLQPLVAEFTNNRFINTQTGQLRGTWDGFTSVNAWTPICQLLENYLTAFGRYESFVAQLSNYTFA